MMTEHLFQHLYIPIKQQLEKPLLWLLLLTILVTPSLYGAHIIGGHMSYKCLGDNNYEVTLVLYRDCASGGALFDSDTPRTTPGSVTVYRDDLNNPFISEILLEKPSVTRIPSILDNPCLTVPPNLCVEEGVYRFFVTLPTSDFSYHIVYQRCCRNETILNILDPDGTGATFTIEMTPLAQRLCYDSPEAEGYPPIALCLGEYLDVDLSASDEYMDTEIRYEFCSPLDGGGRDGSDGTGDPESPTGVAPNPDTPPPHETVNFRTPVYTATRPMAGDPVVSIDPMTGIISGSPNVSGQFVAGVCATQTLNGEVLTVMKREFQFNVVECQRKVYADLGGVFSRDQESVTYKFCGPREITIENKSTDENFIKTYDWEFLIDGEVETFNTRNPTISFRDTGVYKGVMILNKDEPGCNDSLGVTVEIRNLIKSEFEVTLNSCDPDDVTFTNSSYSENGPVTEYSWFLEQDTIKTRLPDYQFLEPGIKNVTLAVADEFDCYDTLSQELAYYPNPRTVGIDIFGDLLCTRTVIDVSNLSSPINDEYDFLWDFGDGVTSTERNPSILINNEGTYFVSLSITSPIGCMLDTTFGIPIEVFQKPLSLFDYNPEQLSSLSKSIRFINLSEDASTYTWNLDYSFLSSLESPSHTFIDTGFYQVDLIAEADNGCVDTSSQIIDVVPITTYFLPNAFSPNSDGQNDLYLGRGYLEYMENFVMRIYDRWGRLQFETTDPLEGWNGRYMNDGKACQSDVYVCKVSYQGARNKVEEIEATVTLLQ